VHTPWVTMQVYLAKVNWGIDLFVSLGYITEAQHQSRRNRPYHLCLSNQRHISVFVPAKHTKMKDKSKPEFTQTKLLGFKENSLSILLACCLSSHHFSIIAIPIYLYSTWNRKKRCPNWEKIMIQTYWLYYGEKRKEI